MVAGSFHLGNVYAYHINVCYHCVAPPCFCLNGGYYNGSECVCVNNYLGAFCDNSSRIGKASAAFLVCSI